MARRRQPASRNAAPTGELARLRALMGEGRALLPWIGAILALAALLRFFQLGQASLWMDEIVIFREAYAREYRTVSFRAHSAHLVPVSWLLNTLGQTPTVLRLWSALLGTLACPLLMLWALWTAGRSLAIAAGVFSATSCFLLMYAQDGNYYAGMVFYLSIQLAGYALFFRGAPHAGLALAVLGGVVGFLNHPISAIPTATILGGMLVGSLVFPSVRASVWSLSPRAWQSRPLLPLLAVALLASIPFALPLAPRVGGFLSTMIDPGASGLTNVRLGARLFLDHGTGLMVNFHRVEPWHRALGGAAWMLALAGCALVLWQARQDRDPALAAFAGLVIVTVLASYAVLFSLSVSRNFNLRYFAYLVPLLGGAALSGPAMLARRLAPRRADVATLALLPLTLPFALVYIATDHTNYRNAGPVLSRSPQAPILAATRNDTVEAAHYLGEAGLPTLPPAFAFLNQPGYADLFAGAMPYALSQQGELWIISAWRYVEQPRLYTLLDQRMPLAYAGKSKWGAEHDLRIHRWQAPPPGPLPNLAFRDGSGRIKAPAFSDPLRLDFHGAASMPEHTRYFLRYGMLRNERDGAIDFLLYQPAQRRHLAVTVAAPSPDDALLRQNARPVPLGLVVGIAVDGVHRGFWSFPDADGAPFSFVPALEIAPGNHRITISGLMPRRDYTPYFPWRFGSVDWSAIPPSAPIESDESRGLLALSPGWSALPVAGAPGGALAEGWQASTPDLVRIDESLRGPAGDPAIRIQLAADFRDSFLLATPPMPVVPGTLATYWFHLRVAGLEQQELTPLHLFIDAAGQPLGANRLANGPNIRGTTLGAGWIRRQVTVPVPANAAFMVGGFQSFPLPRGETSGAVIHAASFASPGVQGVRISDTMLADSYFGFAEDGVVE